MNALHSFPSQWGGGTSGKNIMQCNEPETIIMIPTPCLGLECHLCSIV